jgi:hypothetical protein
VNSLDIQLIFKSSMIPVQNQAIHNGDSRNFCTIFLFYQEILHSCAVVVPALMRLPSRIPVRSTPVRTGGPRKGKLRFLKPPAVELPDQTSYICIDISTSQHLSAPLDCKASPLIISSLDSQLAPHPAMSKVTEITSSSQFQKALSSNTSVIVDFNATWCGASALGLI